MLWCWYLLKWSQRLVCHKATVVLHSIKYLFSAVIYGASPWGFSEATAVSKFNSGHFCRLKRENLPKAWRHTMCAASPVTESLDSSGSRGSGQNWELPHEPSLNLSGGPKKKINFRWSVHQVNSGRTKFIISSIFKSLFYILLSQSHVR